MVREGTWPPIPVLLPPRLGPFSSASCCRRLRSHQKRRPPTIATRATRPITRPTVPPVPSLFELPFDVGELVGSGGPVGVTVTVLTIPVMVWRDWIGVGVQVEDWGEDTEVCKSQQGHLFPVLETRVYNSLAKEIGHTERAKELEEVEEIEVGEEVKVPLVLGTVDPDTYHCPKSKRLPIWEPGIA
jgi:hypothetical protein